MAAPAAGIIGGAIVGGAIASSPYGPGYYGPGYWVPFTQTVDLDQAGSRCSKRKLQMIGT
jgi:hypothetical protein